MTTPQNPGDGETPQDPSDPQNPYGTPPPPPSDPGAPSTPPPSGPPPSTPPPASPPPSDPGPPTTPIPSAPPGAPATPPPYGEQPATPAPPPAAPYGQPSAPGQPAYGAPGYGAPMPGPAEPGKGMAITALILSILGCTCIGALIAIPLAIVVLVRSRSGQNHGKGLAIAALIISVISLIAVAVGGYFLYDYAKDFKDVDEPQGRRLHHCQGSHRRVRDRRHRDQVGELLDQARRRGPVHGDPDLRGGGQLQRDHTRSLLYSAR